MSAVEELIVAMDNQQPIPEELIDRAREEKGLDPGEDVIYVLAMERMEEGGLFR